MSESSVWWPIPVASSRWFSEEERRASREYHDPIQRAAVLRSTGQILGAIAALWWVDRTQSDGAWWWVVVAVLAAVALPRLIADAWHEYIHEPRFDVSPVAAAAFAVTAVGRLAIEGGLLALGFVLLRETGDEPLAVVGFGCVAASIPLASALIGPRIVLLIHRATDVSVEHEAHQHVAALAAANGLSTPRLVELDRASFEGANAYVTGHRADLTVAVSHRLLNGPDALLRHVVGHEITHLRQRHLLWSAVGSSLSIGLTVGVALALTVRLADGDARLPLLVLVAVALSQPFRFGLAWLSRAHERQADRSAMRHAPIPPELIKQLHLSDRPLLEPSRLARWQSSHPTPAERLEAAERSSRGRRAGAAFVAAEEQGSIDS